MSAFHRCCSPAIRCSPDEKSGAAAAVRFIEQRFLFNAKTLSINPIGTDADFLQIGRRESGTENAKCTEPFISKSIRTKYFWDILFEFYPSIYTDFY